MFHAPAFLQKYAPLRKLSFSLFRRYVEAFKPRFSVERRMGALLLLDKRNKVDLHLLCAGAWEADRIAYLRDLVLRHKSGRRALFLDIGAHGGLYSVLLEKAVGFDRLVAFEPEPISLAQMRANVMMNDIGHKVEIVAKAVSDTSGTALFHVAHESNRGQSHLLRAEDVARKTGRAVELATVDAYVTELGALVVAKIDVEGHEDEVLRGMRRTLHDNSAIVQLERNIDDIEEFERTIAATGLRRVHSIGQDHYFVKL